MPQLPFQGLTRKLEVRQRETIQLTQVQPCVYPSSGIGHVPKVCTVASHITDCRKKAQSYLYLENSTENADSL